MSARSMGLSNFCIIPCNKLVPPAMRALLEKDDAHRIDAFLLPGHVAVVLGLAPFEFLAKEFGRPSVVGGFEPADILSALCLMLDMLRRGRPEVGNTYVRAVSPEGSPQARRVMDTVFRVADARWRGLGDIPKSGLACATSGANLTPWNDSASNSAKRGTSRLPLRRHPSRGALAGSVSAVRQGVYAAESHRPVHGFHRGKLRGLVSLPRRVENTFARRRSRPLDAGAFFR